MDLAPQKPSPNSPSYQGNRSKIQHIIPLTIAVGITLGCTQPLRSAQTEVLSTDSGVSNNSEVFTVSNDLPTSSDSIPSPDETRNALSEGEMMRFEALETAISDENLTPLTSSCRMGECIETYYTFTYLDQEINDERLYETEVITHQVPMGETLGRWILQDAPTQVLCSKQRPMVVFFQENQYIINNLSPGTEPGGVFMESDALYWAICHDINITEYPTSQLREEKAIELGYSLGLSASQTNQPVLKLMDN
jgi:hypothetical protein